jgi:hypothetical protein
MVKNVYTYLESIAKEIKLHEGYHGVKRVLVDLYREGTSSVRDIAFKTNFAPPIISLLFDKLATDGIIHRDRSGVKFTLQGMKFVERELSIRSLPIQNCMNCEGKQIAIDPGNSHSHLISELEQICQQRPSADVQLDQAKCTPETILRRLLLLHKEHAFDGTSILFLGDDDFMSIASQTPAFTNDYFVYPNRGKETLPFKITVMDVDDRILLKIQEMAQELGRDEVFTVNYDVRNPFPANFINSFDIVFLDPPYTYNGVKLFLSRAINGLKEDLGAKIFLSLGHMRSKDLQKIQEHITHAGFYISAAIPAFNTYEGGNIIGNISQLWVLTLASQKKFIISPNIAFEENFYTQINC